MFALLSLFACATEGQVCTDLYAYSTTLTVTSSSGEALTGVSGTYTVDGGEERPCEGSGDSGGLWCGGEEAGHFVITVTADGHDAATVEADVVMDDVGCHVVGEALTVVLEPSAVDCTDEERPSVVVTLVSDAGGSLSNAWAEWNDPAADMAPQPCDATETPEVFRCGWERAGDFEVMAGADYHTTETWTGTVSLTADECHVETESVEITLLAYDF